MPDNIQTIASDKMRLEMTVDESSFFIKTPGDKEVPIVTSQVNPLTGNIIKNIWNGTQAQYDAIAVKDDSTLYVIV